MEDLKNKVVLITGSSTGIGAAVAKAFGANGAKVAVHYNSSKSEAEEVASEIEASGGQAITLQGDVTDSDVCARLVDDTVARMGRIDVLVNNAGGLIKRIPIAEISEDMFDRVVALNQRSALMCTRAAAGHMRNSGGGAIINVTSIAARHGGATGAVLYAGTKGFISTITRGFAKELVKDNIRVNAVSPGVINTPFHERFSTPEMLEGFKATIPMNRLGEADECAGAFLFLASEKMSGYITGQIIEVNGGQYMP
ncbi:MAG: glucose 1-dehydrogenase [Betaproteobacteria bacterium]|nr:MAG: glucose 1-dehydrogenase [Betaproteobacteria bacterium]